MMVLGIVLAVAATGLGLWALVLQMRTNPQMPMPVVTGRLSVDPARARSVQAGMAGLAVMAGTLAATEIGMMALWLAAPSLLVPVLAALGYNLWLGRRQARHSG